MGDGALEQALRWLRHRDRSVFEVDRYLAARGTGVLDRERAVATLLRTGVIDDRRFALARAASLAGRGAGDGLIMHELAEAGVASELVDEALAHVEPEIVRARRVVARRGGGPRTTRYLFGRGFSEDVVSAVVAEARRETLG